MPCPKALCASAAAWLALTFSPEGMPIIAQLSFPSASRPGIQPAFSLLSFCCEVGQCATKFAVAWCIMGWTPDQLAHART